MVIVDSVEDMFFRIDTIEYGRVSKSFLVASINIDIGISSFDFSGSQGSMRAAKILNGKMNLSGKNTQILRSPITNGLRRSLSDSLKLSMNLSNTTHIPFKIEIITERMPKI